MFVSNIEKVFALANAFCSEYGLDSLGGETPYLRAITYVHDAMHIYLDLGVSITEEIEVTLFQLALCLPRDEWEDALLTMSKNWEFPVDLIPEEVWERAQDSPLWIKEVNRKYPVTVLFI